MRDVIKLNKPIDINGEKRTELSYDTEKITGEQFLEADTRAHVKAAQLGKVNITVAETDSSLQLYLGYMAVIAENPDIDITDLERICGYDIMKFYRLGRNFIKGSAVAEDKTENPDSEESNLEEHTEAMPEPSMLTSEN